MLRSLLLTVLLSPLALGVARECRDDLDESEGYTIRSVKIEGRWVPQIALPIAPGDRYSNAKVQEAMRAVQSRLRSDERASFELQNLGAVGVVHIARCLLVEDRQVDVIIEARSVRIDLFELGGNVLPIPRAAFATFYDAVPEPILALNPRIGAYEDKRYGFAPTAALRADLLALGKTARAKADPNISRLDLVLNARKSVDEEFYDVDLGLALNQTRAGEFLEKVSWTAAFSAADEPRGSQTFSRRSGELGGMVRLRPAIPGIQTLYIGGGYRFAENEFFQTTRSSTSEHGLVLRVLGEGRLAGGFLRAALWGDAGFPDDVRSYGRAAGVLAFEKEVLVAPNQTIGIETVIGGGRAWSAPAYARYYAGNSRRDFLYDSPESRSLIDFPTGPLIRSLGEGTSSTGRSAPGVTNYWHLNVKIALPIPALSFPLIPNEEVAPGLTLKRLLKNKAADSVAFYAAELEAEGHSPDDALRIARKTYGEVQPAIDYIADRANAYAVKPLLLFDLAGQDSGTRPDRVQAAVGGGIQVTVVTAKMELCYMHAVFGPTAGSDNLFGRIIFHNIF